MFKKLLYVLCLSSILMPMTIWANAYCSLRDPIVAINHLFPSASNHKSIVKIVGNEARVALKDALPFTFHFNELGKHTLYVAMQGNDSKGFIHARTELTEKGLVEIAWALNLDLSAKNFYIQRCRIAACKDENINFLRNYIEGKTFEEILTIYQSKDKSFYEEIFYKSEEVKSLTSSILQSALKTMVVTGLVWGDDIDKINSIAFAKHYYPDASNANKIHSTLSEVDLKKIQQIFGNDINYINHETVRSLKITDNKRNLLAYFVKAGWNAGQNSGKFSWLISPHGKVIAVRPSSSWPNLEIESSFNTVVGQNIKSPSDCSSFAEVALSELFHVSGITAQTGIK